MFCSFLFFLFFPILCSVLSHCSLPWVGRHGREFERSNKIFLWATLRASINSVAAAACCLLPPQTASFVASSTPLQHHPLSPSDLAVVWSVQCCAPLIKLFGKLSFIIWCGISLWCHPYAPSPAQSSSSHLSVFLCLRSRRAERSVFSFVQRSSFGVQQLSGIYLVQICSDSAYHKANRNHTKQGQCFKRNYNRISNILFLSSDQYRLKQFHTCFIGRIYKCTFFSLWPSF